MVEKAPPLPTPTLNPEAQATAQAEKIENYIEVQHGESLYDIAARVAEETGRNLKDIEFSIWRNSGSGSYVSVGTATALGGPMIHPGDRLEIVE